MIIRPDRFSQDKIAYDALYPLVQRTTVSLRSDNFPNVVLSFPLLRGTDCIGQDIEAGYFLEAWNMYQSGQFVHYSGMIDDWSDQSGSRLPEGWQPGNSLAIEEVVRQYTGIFVFASRLALTDAYAQDTHLSIDVLIKSLQGRYLYIATPRKIPLLWDYKADIPEFRSTKRLQRDELIANAKELAIQASRELFLRFGWDAAQVSLENIQSTFNLGS